MQEFCIFNPKDYSNTISISEDEYTSLVNAKSKLQNFLYIEEKLNFVIENYLDLEKEILNITLNKMVRPINNIEWSASVEEIHQINRRIINFLTTSRMYLDHVAHDLKEAFDDKPEIVTVFRKLTNKAYDSVLGYRVMEALRNYVQHRGLPVHILSYKSSRINESKIRNTVSPVLRIRDIEHDGKFKKQVLEELKLLGATVDLKIYIREYIQSFYEFQKFIRDIAMEEIREYENLINDAYNTSEKVYGKVDFIGVSKLLEHKYYRGTTFIMKDMIQRRKWLEMKNSLDKDILAHYVSGEC